MLKKLISLVGIFPILIAGGSLSAQSLPVSNDVIVSTADTTTTLSQDYYIGGIPSNGTYQGVDVIGDEKFEVFGSSTTVIRGAAVDGSDDKIVIDIYSEYFNNIGELNTDVGDLFISSSALPNNENPIGPLFTENDIWEPDFWNYAVDFQTNDASKGSSGDKLTNPDGSIYNIGNPGDFITVDDIILSDEITNPFFRNDQAVLVDANSSTATDTGLTAAIDLLTVSSDSPLDAAGKAFLEDGVDMNRTPEGSDDTNTLGASIDSADTFLRVTLSDVPAGLLPKIGEASGLLSFRWAMSCANDAIEWQVNNTLTPVPEPAAIALIGLLGLGLVAYRRRKAGSVTAA